MVHRVQMICRLSFATALLGILAGCSGTVPTAPTTASAPPEGQVVVTVTDVPVPSSSAQASTGASASAAAGSASISGQAVSTGSIEPIRQTVIFLAQVYPDANTGEEVFALDLGNSPASFTDDNGNFRFAGVAPGRYVISLGDFYGVKDIVRNPDGTAKVYELENDQPVDAGVIQVRPDVSPGR